MDAARWPFPGSRWWKFDFHTHTPASLDYGKGINQDRIRVETNPREWLLGFMRAGIDCVSVTDHNTGAWIGNLQTALSELEDEKPEGYSPLKLFPGVELSIGRCHHLAIFDPSCTQSVVAGLVGFARYRGASGGSDSSCEASVTDVCAEVARLNGLFIPAHADKTTGIFHELRGNDLKPVLACEAILAVEMCESGSEVPELFKAARLNWARLLGSDAHHPTAGVEELRQQCPGSHFTWIKMAQPTVEGLRLALIDGEGVSVRRSDAGDFDPFRTPEHFVEEINIHDMRFMGRGASACFEFSPFFNALIGGRGTGKSTVVHAARLAFRREGDLERLDENSEARTAFERFDSVATARNAHGGLLSETLVRVIFSRDGVRHRLHWRQDGEGHVVEQNRDSNWEPSESQEVSKERFPVRIFSQGQIAALAGESQQALLDLIDEAAGTRVQKESIEEVRRRYFTLRAEIRELDAKLKGREGLTVQTEDIQRKLKRFEDAHHADILRTFQLATKQEGEVERQFERARQLAERVRATAENLQLEELPPGTFDAETDTEVAAVLQRLARAVEESRARILSAANVIETAVVTEKTAIEASEWKRHITQSRQAYDTLKKELEGQGISNPGEYGRLVQERQRLETDLNRLRELQGVREARAQEAEEVCEQVVQARQDLSQARQRFLQERLSANPFVRMEILPLGRDPGAVETSLREVLGNQDRYAGDIYTPAEKGRPAQGLAAELLVALPDEVQTATMELYERLKAVKERLHAGCSGEDPFGGWFNRFLVDQSQKRPEFFDHLRCWFPDDALRVEYSRRSDGTDFRPITQASAGQRAAAMLALLLAHGSEPLILDQPEDDLDNHLIYDLVVRQIRENKLRRQLIIVTHNPNIVVNGDAEMLHAMEFRSGQCMVQKTGSLQDHDMREEVCRVMEGGREAFNRRYRRLGKEI